MGSKFQLQECVKPFFEEVVKLYPAWGTADWTPSVEDCIRSRSRTCGIVEVAFEHEGHKYKVLDAGGQRAERRKWIHAFEDVTALLFVASLTDYDENLFEDRTKNRLMDSLEVWEDLFSKNFQSTPCILFLNKMDLFVEKYVRRSVPLNVTGLFPDAPPYTPEFPKAIEWIASKYRTQRGTRTDPSTLYVHTTTAVDSNQVDVVFREIKTLVLQKSYSSSLAE